MFLPYKSLCLTLINAISAVRFSSVNTGKGRLCDHRGARRDAKLLRPEPPLVIRPVHVKTLRSEMEATSQISREARDAIIDNVHSGLGGVDVCLN